MEKRRFVAIVVMSLMFTLLTGCAGLSRIESFMQSGEYLQHSKVIDFGLFFVMFFALCYLGLSQVWGKGFGKPGEAKGPIAGLSFALSLSLAFAIVSQTQFSVTTIFPIAKALFFLIIFFLLWGLLVQSKIFGDHWGGKIIAAILALMATYLIFCIFTHMICQMSNNLDDPACQSDFFNAAFNLAGRWFSVPSWASAGGGGYFNSNEGYETVSPSYSGGGGAGGGGGAVGTEVSGASGEKIQGGCRLDITFIVGSSSDYTSGTPLAEYASKVKGKKVHVYGFASKEGEKVFNTKLSSDRASNIAAQLKREDSSVSTSTKGYGETGRFSNDLSPNRRVVISTEPISSFMPAPSPGSIVGCENLRATGEGSENEGTGSGGFSLWWLLLLLLLLPLLILLLKKKKEIDVPVVLRRKDIFLKELKELASRKDSVWNDIMVASVDASTMDESKVRERARAIIESLESELIGKNWKSIRQLGIDYWKDLEKIQQHAKAFDINDQHLKMILKMLKHLRIKCGNDKSFAKDLSSDEFYAKLTETAVELMDNNKVLKEFHEFFVLQTKMKKLVEGFAGREEQVLKQLRNESDAAAKKKADKRKEPAAPVDNTPVAEEQKALPNVVETTQEVRNLCQELIAKIKEVMDEEENVTHHATSRTALSRTDNSGRHFGKYEEERHLIKKLIEAIHRQKERMKTLPKPHPMPLPVPTPTPVPLTPSPAPSTAPQPVQEEVKRKDVKIMILPKTEPRVPHPPHSGSKKELKFNAGSGLQSGQLDFILLKDEGKAHPLAWVCYIIRETDNEIIAPDKFELKINLSETKQTYSYKAKTKSEYKYNFFAVPEQRRDEESDDKIIFSPILELADSVEPGNYRIVLEVAEGPQEYWKINPIPAKKLDELPVIDQNFIQFKIDEKKV